MIDEIWTTIASNLASAGLIIWFGKRWVERVETAINGTKKRVHDGELKLAQHEVWRIETAAQLTKYEQRHAEELKSLWEAIDGIRERCLAEAYAKKER